MPRGFCNCRAATFTGLRLQKNIFTRFTGDDYDIADRVPQRED